MTVLKRIITNAVGVGLGLPVAIFLVWLVLKVQPFRVSVSANVTQISISYPDLVSLMLTAVSIILAALGFVVAIVAVVGWNSIGDRVSTLSRQFLSNSLSDGGELKSMVQKSLLPGGELHTLVGREVRKVAYQGVEAFDAPNNNDGVDVNDGNLAQ